MARRYQPEIYHRLTRNLSIQNWHISPHESFSDHIYIQFETVGIPKLFPDHHSYLTADKDIFKALITTAPILLLYDTSENTTNNAATINTWIEEHLQKATKTSPLKNTPHYWNKTLHQLQHKLKTVKRQIQRSQQNSIKHNSLKTQRKKLTKEYDLETKAAKQKAWRNFVTLASPWGKPYKVCLKFRTPTHISLPLENRFGQEATSYSLSLIHI